MVVKRGYLVESLELVDLRLEAIEFKAWAKYLMQPDCQLKTLRIQNCELSAKAAGILISALSNNKSLTELKLINNKTGDKIAWDLANVLNTNETLITLDISGNKITNVGAGALGAALATNRSLKMLVLPYNEIADFGKQVLKDGAFSLTSSPA